MKEPKTDIGVIVGRFQVPELHVGHKGLIDHVKNKHDRTIIFLGCPRVRHTLNNPLDFESRKDCIQKAYPDIIVYRIDDNRSDEAWSKILDMEIDKAKLPIQTVTLYGSRDSFIKCYSGKYPTCVLESESFISGTEVRRSVINKGCRGYEYRAGLIIAAANRYPTAYQTVDVAILDETKEKILVGKKPGEDKWRFIGGFSDPKSPSLEADARREVMEETGVEITDPVYIGSCKIDDWRYRSEQDCIKTAFFVAKYQSGRPKGGDDISVVSWLTIADLDAKNFVPEHSPLIAMLSGYLGSKS